MAEKEVAIPQLGAGQLREVEYVSHTWIADISIGVRPEQILEPSFWSNFASQLSPWDKIEARAEDGSWYGTYLVLDCSRTWAKVKQLNVYNLTSGDVSLSQSEREIEAVKERYTIMHRGPRRWSVVRKDTDKTVMTEDLPQRENAEEWLHKHAAEEVRGVNAQTERV